MQAIKNTIELNTYEDETLEVKKTFKSYGLKWKAFKAILAKEKEIENAKSDNPEVALDLVREIIRLIYPTIQEEDLDDAYMDDLFNCYQQALSIANNMAKNL